MNYSAITGIFMVIIVTYFGAIDTLPAKEAVFNKTSIFLVLGGTIAAFLIAFPANQLRRIFRTGIKGILGRKKISGNKIVEELIDLAIAVYQKRDLNSVHYSHLFLNEGAILVNDEILDDEDLEYVLRNRAQSFKREYGKDHQTLIALAKFPPAFGLLGSVTGIIAMLMSLGTAGKEIIGQGMAIALLTTFWGVAITNMVILPLADFTQRCNKEDDELRQLIVEGLLLIRQRTPPAVMARKLRSLLSLKERTELSQLQAHLIDQGRHHNNIINMKKHG